MLCYTRSLMVLPEYHKIVRRRLEAWSKRAGKVDVWNWYLDTLSPWRGLPVMYTQAINDDMKFFNQINDGGEFIQAENGTVLDIRYGFGGIMDRSWNGNVITAAKLEENRWILTVTIPFSDLGVKPTTSGVKFGANFYRRWGGDQQSPSYSCWSPTVDANNYTPHRFGMMIFKDGP